MNLTARRQGKMLQMLLVLAKDPPKNGLYLCPNEESATQTSKQFVKLAKEVGIISGGEGQKFHLKNGSTIEFSAPKKQGNWVSVDELSKWGDIWHNY